MKLALATALHHSAQRVEVPKEVEEQVPHAGLRAQKTLPPGTQPVVEHAACPCSSGVPSVPVIIIDEFQQSIPQFQFIHRHLVFHL